MHTVPSIPFRKRVCDDVDSGVTSRLWERDETMGFKLRLTGWLAILQVSNEQNSTTGDEHKDGSELYFFAQPFFYEPVLTPNGCGSRRARAGNSLWQSTGRKARLAQPLPPLFHPTSMNESPSAFCAARCGNTKNTSTTNWMCVDRNCVIPAVGSKFTVTSFSLCGTRCPFQRNQMPGLLSPRIHPGGKRIPGFASKTEGFRDFFFPSLSGKTNRN